MNEKDVYMNCVTVESIQSISSISKNVQKQEYNLKDN